MFCNFYRLFIFQLLIIFIPCFLTAQEEEAHEDWISFEGDELLVVAQAPQQETNPAVPQRSVTGMRSNIVSEEQIQQQGAIDFSGTLKNVPGVIVSQRNMAGTTTGSSLHIRGRGYTHPSTDITVYFDGVPRYGFIYGQSMADSIPLNAIGHVEVRKSPQPSEFGQGYALVNIEPRYMNENGWTAQGGFSGGSYFTFLQNAAFGYRSGRFDIFAAQSWISTNGHVVHSGSNQQSYYLNMGLLINPNWNLRLLGNYAGALTEQAPYSGQSFDDILSSYRTDSVFSTLTLNNEYNNAKGKIKLYYTNTQFKWLDENIKIPGDWSLQSLQAFGVRAREEITLLERGNITAGMDLDWKLMVNEDYNTTSPTVITTFPAMILYSPYAGISWQFGSKEIWRITPSAAIRGFIHSVWANQISWQGALVLGWKNLDLNFNYSRGLVYPAPAVIQNLLGNSAVFQMTDLNSVEPEKIDHFEAGITFAPKPSHFFSCTLDGSYFYDNGKNRIIVTSQVPGNASSVSSFKLQGLELAASFKIFPYKLYADTIELFAGSTWYTDLKVTDENRNTAKQMPFIPVFNLSAGFRWVFLKHLNLSGDIQYLHNLYTGTMGLSSVITAPVKENKLDDIFLLNLRLGFKLIKENWHLADSEIFVLVNNVLNTQYEYYTGYIMPGVTFITGFNIKFK